MLVFVTNIPIFVSLGAQSCHLTPSTVRFVMPMS